MSLPNTTPNMGRAEKEFREAFERLKRGKPERLPRGTIVSQNNVAKEASCDPSALRKSRYPSLIAEIQRWIKEHAPDTAQSPRQKILAQRGRNRSLREKIEALKTQRDLALSLLVEADARILDLSMDNARLQALRPVSNITLMHDPKGVPTERATRQAAPPRKRPLPARQNSRLRDETEPPRIPRD